MSGNENSRRIWEERERAFDFIEEVFEEKTPDEIAEAARADGVDIRATADRVRAVFARAYEQVNQSKLREARAAFESEARDLGDSRDDDLPDTYEEQLALLACVNAARPGLLQGMTVAYRNFDRVAPEDLRSLLLQLKRLGALDNINLSKRPE